MRYHRLAAADVRALATGLGGPALVQALHESRLSRHLLLLRSLVARWEDAGIHNLEAIEVLARVQAHHPQQFAELLADPLTGAWLARSARRLRETRMPDLRDALHLGAVAAAAAMQTGTECTVISHSINGRLALPGLGEAFLTEAADEPLLISVSSGQAKVTGSATTVVLSEGAKNWHPSRRLSAQHEEYAITVRVEDASPYRDTYHAAAANRLSPAEADEWRIAFNEAWGLLVRCMPERCGELAVGLKVLIPLVDKGDGSARSGTARDSVGAIGLTRPQSAQDLAITIVHEFQHSKLSAVSDLDPFHRTPSTERHFAPWRTDARPTSALIQGVYAFLGVADAWHHLRSVPELEEKATRQFALAREQVNAGLRALENSAELTELGRRFVDDISIAVGRLLDQPLPPEFVKQAQATLRAARTIWAQRQPQP